LYFILFFTKVEDKIKVNISQSNTEIPRNKYQYWNQITIDKFDKVD